MREYKVIAMREYKVMKMGVVTEPYHDDAHCQLSKNTLKRVGLQALKLLPP